MSLFRGIPRPLAETRDDLDRAIRKGEPPLLSKNSILDLLQLSGDKRDGLSLAERFLASNNLLDKLLQPTSAQIYALTQTVALTERLLDRLGGHQEDGNQLAVAKNMIAVAERQITREGVACPLATGLYQNLSVTRPELVDPKVAQQMGGPQALLGIIMQLIGSSSREMSHLDGFEIHIVDMSRNRRKRE